MDVPYTKKNRIFMDKLIHQYNIPRRRHIVKQRKWRETQRDIFYNTGRPIFSNIKTANYFFYKNDNGNCVGNLVI
jgi:hypothetical protein